MKELWVKVSTKLSQETKIAILKASVDTCDVIVTCKEDVKLAKSLGAKTASFSGGDIQLVELSNIVKLKDMKVEKPFCVRIVIKDKLDEEKAVATIGENVDYILVSCPDWKVIPLENLISRIRGKAKLLAEVSDVQEARLALETLELGVDGVVLEASDPCELVNALEVLKNAGFYQEKKTSKIMLRFAKILSVKQLGLGTRACIDTCDLMVHGEGMLVGCHSSALFLVQAEVEENPHVEPRPFRVNAGAVSLYILSSKDMTRYLSELVAGNEVLVVDKEGNFRNVVVSRVKVERRPLCLVEADIEGMTAKTIVQNAETVRFITNDGSIPISELKPNDEVLVRVQLGGRHFGVLVKEESVIER